MKKFFLILLSLFIITGCDVEYNLSVNGISEENVYALSSYADKSSDVISSTMHYIDSQLSKGILIEKNSDSFYEANLVDDGIDYGFSLKGTFRGESSNLIDSSCKRYEYSLNNDVVEISAGDFIVYDKYDDLDNLIINIKCDYEILDQNSDYYKNGVYTWKINKDNYQDKKIYMKYRVASNKDYSLIFFVIGICCTIVLGFVIYQFLRIYFKRKNSV